MQLKQHSLEQCGHSRASRSFSMQIKHRNTSAMLWKRTGRGCCYRLRFTRATAALPGRSPSSATAVPSRSARPGSTAVPHASSHPFCAALLQGTAPPPPGPVTAHRTRDVPAPYSPTRVTPQSRAPPRTAQRTWAAPLRERNRRPPLTSTLCSSMAAALPEGAGFPRLPRSHTKAGSARSRRGQAAHRRPVPGRPQP